MSSIPKNLVIFSFSYTDSKPGLSTEIAGTWFGRIPNVPVVELTSTCFTPTLS